MLNVKYRMQSNELQFAFSLLGPGILVVDLYVFFLHCSLILVMQQNNEG